MLRIGNGTKNADKIGAVIGGCVLAGAMPELTNDDADSGIPPQPETIAQILRGAKNRARGMRERYPGLDLYMGIESGIQVDYDDGGNGLIMDSAMIAILYGDDQWACSTSPGVLFPEEFLREWVASGRKGTLGEFIAAKRGGTRSDPHRTLTDGRVTRPRTLVYGVLFAMLQLPPEILYR